MQLYPVTVTMPDGTTSTKAKLFSSLDHTTVYVWPDSDDAPSVLVQASRPPERARQNNRWTLTLDDGQVVQLDQGCGGCSHTRLKRWQPTPGPVRAETSTTVAADT